MTKIEQVENFLKNELGVDTTRANQLANQIFNIIEFGVDAANEQKQD